MKRINTIKLSQDLLPPLYRKVNRLDWAFLKNILNNNKLEYFYRKYDSGVEDANYNNQVMSFEGYLNKKMTDFYDLNPLNVWTGVTWTTVAPCYIVDSGYTYVEISGTSQFVDLKTNYVQTSTQLLTGVKFKIACNVKSWDMNIAPYIYLSGSTGQISDNFGLSMGYNEVVVEATSGLNVGDYLHVCFFNDAVSGLTTSVTIDELIIGQVIDSITTVGAPLDAYAQWVYSSDYMTYNPLEQEQYYIADTADVEMNITTVNISGLSGSTIISGQTATITLTKDIDVSGVCYINTTGTYNDYSTPFIQIIVSDILFTGSVYDAPMLAVSSTTPASDDMLLDCRFQNQIFDVEIDPSYSLQNARLKLILPEGLTSLSFNMSIKNDSGIKYTSNQDENTGGFIVFVPYNIYNAERNNYLTSVIENKRPAGAEVKIQYF
jgi:hypothetical protein